MSVSIFSTLISLNWLLNKSPFPLAMSFTLLVGALWGWQRDFTRESIIMGCYNFFMQISFKVGMILFIFSELLFFISFFWSYFHFMLMFSAENGLEWPGSNLVLTNPLSIPLLNTLILLSSGYTLSVTHSEKMRGNKIIAAKFLIITMCFGVIFTFFQSYEYSFLPLLWSDSSYGSIFYLGTGFHGTHVIIGAIMLFFSLVQLLSKVSWFQSVLFDNSAWYWHFVDVIWIILFSEFYWWPYQV